MEEASVANTRDAPRGLKAAARLTAALMEEASAARLRTASSPLKATRGTALCTVEAGAARLRTASSPLKATPGTSDELTVLYSNGPDDKVN